MQDVKMLLILSGSLAIFSGCREVKLENCAKLNVDDPIIIQFAESYARKHYDLSRLMPPIVHINEETPVRLMSISYWGKSNNPHDYFAVHINLKTCKAWIAKSL